MKKIKQWFWCFGFPRSIRSDGGPQFRGGFKTFCEEHGVDLERSSPYNPRSNGLAEVTVRILKDLLSKAKGHAFERAFSAWKNSERGDKPSPNCMFFRQRDTRLPSRIIINLSYSRYAA